MLETGKKAMAGLVFAVGLMGLLPSGVQAATKTIACPGKSLQNAVTKLNPGDTLLVSGTCAENVVIPEQIVNVTLNGQGTATIQGADPTQNTINVRGRGVTIAGFTISGGNRTISLQRGGSAIITGNTITGSQTHGVQLSQNNYAKIQGNTIQGNSDAGVHVRLGSGADIWDNVITANFDGIKVDTGGSADISGNHIYSNTEDGVRLRSNSNVRFSHDEDDTTVNVIEGNGENGVNCRLGGSIGGNPVSWGSGNTGGNKSIDGTCLVESGVLP